MRWIEERIEYQDKQPYLIVYSPETARNGLRYYNSKTGRAEGDVYDTTLSAVLCAEGDINPTAYGVVCKCPEKFCPAHGRAVDS
jgi:hypothetical protein